MKISGTRESDSSATHSIIINAVQIAAIAAFTLYIVFLGPREHKVLTTVLIIAAILTISGAMLDIGEALRTRKRLRTISQLQDTNTQMDDLNLRLRAQRHDFLNHMQVVYNLIELEEYEEAKAYLERESDEIRSLSRVLQTRVTAFNALLAAKDASCRDRGITLETDIRTDLQGLGLPSWELCTVIGNLVNNAMDAIGTMQGGRITLAVREELTQFTFRVSNNGPVIPEDIRNHIFEANVSTKGNGRGMGLSIARSVLSEYGGSLTLEEGNEVAFLLSVPREKSNEKEAENA